ncbi:MAG TPA: hydrolase [Eubacteriaceae bacterium]|nr:hydrolase [Eubacteriaceae bacterium]
MTAVNYEEAMNLLKEYNKEPFHIRHAEVVSGILGYFAAIHDPDNKAYWEIVGLLHDLDFEQYPDEHCEKTAEILRERGYDESFIRSVKSHGYQIVTEEKPEHIMEKFLYATDELSGLIGATAIMRPSKSFSDLKVKSVMKKFKQPSFAKGCSREVIQNGADMLNMELSQLIDQTIEAMRSMGGEILDAD